MSLSPSLSGTQRVQKLDFIQILRTVGWLSEMKRPKSAMCATFLCLLLFALDTFRPFQIVRLLWNFVHTKQLSLLCSFLSKSSYWFFYNCLKLVYLITFPNSFQWLNLIPYKPWFGDWASCGIGYLSPDFVTMLCPYSFRESNWKCECFLYTYMCCLNRVRQRINQKGPLTC